MEEHGTWNMEVVDAASERESIKDDGKRCIRVKIADTATVKR